MDTPIGLAIICILAQMILVQGEGKFWMKLLTYDNPRGKGSNGHCCDGRSFFCQIRGCDHYFHICVDNFNGNDDINSCAFGTRHSGVVKNKDYITFGEDVSGLANPVLFNFQTWAGGVKIKIKVWDDDNNNDDFVDDLTVRQNMYAAPSEEEAMINTVQLQSRTTLDVELKVWCDDHWFGPRCDVYCQPRLDRYQCHPDTGTKICNSGWTGEECNVNIDECTSAPCAPPGGSCVDLTDGYRCDCAEGYTGSHCETDVDECASQPCLNSATCQDQPALYHCMCIPGYTGTHCETDVDECKSRPCQHGGTCVDELNQFQCNCEPGYDGNVCEHNINECESGPCFNGATCIDRLNEFTCICPAGFEGTTCAVNIDECESNPCHGDKSNCIDMINGFMCECPAGFTGPTCHTEIYECQSVPCQNGGNCTDVINGFICSCNAGWEGSQCELNVDDCENVTCGVNMICVDGVNTYNCTCSPGWEGENCTGNINECVSNPCNNNGTCEDMVNGYTCACGYGWNGTHCENMIDFCDSQPCLNHASCIPKFGLYICNCSQNWTGVNCEKTIDPCYGYPCGPNGTCYPTLTGEFNCSCELGWSGPQCSVAPPTCTDHLCQNNASCKDRPGGVLCQCLPEFTGMFCEISHSTPDTSTPSPDTNHTCTCPDNSTVLDCCNNCASRPCHNQGMCVARREGSYTCECQSGFTGRYCESIDQAIIPTKDQSTTVPVLDKVDSNAFLFLGEMVWSDQVTIVTSIVNMTAEYLNLYTTDVRVDYNINTCDGDQQSVVSVFIFKLTAGDKILSYTVVEAIFGSLSDDQMAALFPLPLYTGEECQDLTTPTLRLKQVWIDRFWWVLVITVVILVIIALIVYVFIRQVRSSKWSPTEGQTNPIYEDDLPTYNQISSPSQEYQIYEEMRDEDDKTFGDSLYFENGTYKVMNGLNQEIKDPLEDTDKTK